MGQQCSIPGDGTSSASSSLAPAASSSPPTTPAGGRTRSDNSDVRAAQPWGNNISTVMASLPGRTESDVRDFSSHRPRTENEVCRMSIRAAIDTFIENCLSAHNDCSPQTDDKSADDSQTNTSMGSPAPADNINGDEKKDSNSQQPKRSYSPKDGTESHVNTLDSENLAKIQTNEARDNKKTELNGIVIKEAPTEQESNNQTQQPKETELVNSQPVHEKESVENSQKSRINENPIPTSNEKLSSQPKTTEKQTFSAYLQERLKTIDLDKHEELTQLALSKDIHCHGQMFMWEMARKPVDGYDSTSPAQSGQMLSSGPVRLQTVIDRVLDNSLRSQNQNSSYSNGEDVSTSEGKVHEKASSLTSLSKTSRDQLEPQENHVSASATKTTRMCFKDHIEKVLLESFLSFEEEERLEALKAEGGISRPTVETDVSKINSSKSGNNRPSVEADRQIGGNNRAPVETSKLNSPKGGNNRSTIEKDRLAGGNNRPSVEANKLNSSKGGNNRPVETDRLSGISKGGNGRPFDVTDSGSLNNGKDGYSRTSVERDKGSVATDGTISVQDIVDQVISQTEMISKLLTPSARDLSKLTPSPGQSDNSGQPSGLSLQSNPGSKLYSNNRALQEAQRHAVQKEHQSSTNLGRKRGRPRLGSPVNTSSNKYTSDTSRDVKAGYHDARSGLAPSHGNDHPHMSLTSRDYILTNHFPAGAPSGYPSIVTSKGMMPPSSTMFQQSHDMMMQKSTAPSSAKKCLMTPGTASSGYPLNNLDNFHQQRVGQHTSIHPHPHQNQSQPIDSGHMSGPNIHQSHILTDRAKESISSNNRLIPVSHIPTKSCSCHSCLAHFSKGKPVPQSLLGHQHTHYPFSKLDSAGDRAHHPVHYHPSPSAISHVDPHDFYSQTISPNKSTPSPVTPLPGQGLQSQNIIPTFLAAQRPKKDASSTPTSREFVADARGCSPVHYQLPQSHMSQANLKPPLVDTRFTFARTGNQTDHFIVEDESFQRSIRDKGPHIAAMEASKIEGGSLGASMSQDFDQPLDLSIKPSPAHNQDTRTCFDSSTDLSRQEAEFCVRRMSYRRSSSDLPPRSEGQYMDHEPQAPSGHHLQKLENSVDRFLFHRHSQPQYHLSLYSPGTQLSQQRQKISPLPAMGRPEGHGGLLPHHSQEHHYPEASSLGHGSPGHTTSLHPHQFPVAFTHTASPSSQQLPLMSQPPHHHGIIESSTCDPYQTRSQDLIQNIPMSKVASPILQLDHGSGNQTYPIRSGSATSYQRPPSHSQEIKTESTPTMEVPYGASPARSHSSPSPEDQKMNLCKHEPIQNIIGSHPPSDILYLICLLCRQTYGSPYGFRKHFRNQHGFEPKADHTVIQTISATKTAMAHTSPSEASKKPLPAHPVKEEKFHDDLYLHTQTIKSSHSGSAAPTLGQPSLNPVSSEDIKSECIKDIKSECIKELPVTTKCLECPECGQTFQLNDFGSYKRHCRQHSLHRSSGPFACHECERSFSEPSHLQEHLATHSSFTPSVCGICRTFFSSPSYLAVHLQAAHGIVNGSESGQRLTDSIEIRSSESTRMSDGFSEPVIHSDISNMRKSTSFSDSLVRISPLPLYQNAASSGYSAASSVSSHIAVPSSHSVSSVSSHNTVPSMSSQNTTPSVSIHNSALSMPGHSVPSVSSHNLSPSMPGHSVPSVSSHNTAPSMPGHSVPSVSSHNTAPSMPGHSVPSVSSHNSVHSTVTSGQNVAPSSHTATPSGYGSTASSQSATNLPLTQSATSSSEHQSLVKPASSSPSPMANVLPVSKRHRFNPHNFTVHTPKGLEIQKRPADAVVTTASPDSSYDEAKLPLETNPLVGALRKVPLSEKLDTAKGSNSEDGENNSSCADSKINLTTPRTTDSTTSKKFDKDEAESNSSDRCTSVDSVCLSLGSSRATSPEITETDKYYQHKKYSRHRKRVSSVSASSEPMSKFVKVEGSNLAADRKEPISLLVSSTLNSGVTVRDCESSCSCSEDSSFGWCKRCEGKKCEGKHPSEVTNSQTPGDTKGGKSDVSNIRSNSGDISAVSVTGDSGINFKWDRQTRSQVGKSFQSNNCTS